MKRSELLTITALLLSLLLTVRLTDGEFAAFFFVWTLLALDMLGSSSCSR